MKRTMMIAGCAIALAGSVQAGLPAGGGPSQWAVASDAAVAGLADPVLPVERLARHGADDGAGDDHGGRGGHGRGHGADDGSDGTSGSGRKKPRIPGGSGCDDPGDLQEHASCSG